MCQVSWKAWIFFWRERSRLGEVDIQTLLVRISMILNGKKNRRGSSDSESCRFLTPYFIKFNSKYISSRASYSVTLHSLKCWAIHSYLLPSAGEPVLQDHRFHDFECIIMFSMLLNFKGPYALIIVRFRPRILIDVTKIDLSTTILGYKISMPIMIAPTAMQKMAHPEGTPSPCGESHQIIQQVSHRKWIFP